MMMVKGGMRVVSYGRVSRVLGRAGDSFLSPREQRDRIAQWASDHGATIVEHLEDLDVSGGTIDRPGFQRALALIEAGEADVLVTARLDRFARSIPLAYQAIERLEAAGGTFVSVADGFDLTTPSGRLTFNIMASFAEFELLRLKAGWKVAKASAIERGVVIGPTPWGFTRESERHGRPHGALVPDQRTGPMVTEAYQRALRDVRLAHAYLLQVAPEKNWTLFTVRRLLSSPAYMGTAQYGDLVQRDAHPALVDGVTWRRVQKGLGVADADRRAPAELFPLSSLAVCATCGGPMVGARMGADANGHGRKAYRCNRNKRRGSDVRCERPALVLADSLEQYVRGLLVRAAQEREAALEADTGIGRLGIDELGPDDVIRPADDLRDAVADAEAALERLESMRDRLSPDAFAAAVEAQDRLVMDAREALAAAEADEDQPGILDDVQVASAPAAVLGEFLEAWGLRVRVSPGRGRLGERVALVPNLI